MNLIVSIYLLFVNLVSFLLYKIDKKRACMHKYRIPEKVLLLFSVIGGCFGSTLGMYLFHHKTKHIKFIIVNYLCITIFIIIFLRFKLS